MKLDMLCRLRSQSLSKAKFDHAYASLYGHSGGWLSSTCPHNITYAIKFLLRSESPRDYVDIFRSMAHVPTVNIADIANSIARLGNRISPGLFHPNEGRVVSVSDVHKVAAKEGRLSVSMPFLLDDRPKDVSGDQHPITGSSDKFMLFDWFHQDNCQVESELLRRSSLVSELAGVVNTQAAEQLHRDKARDLYWLNEMKPTNHIFGFRLVTHLKNMRTNQCTLDRQSKTIPEFTLNLLGQLVKNDSVSILAPVGDCEVTSSIKAPKVS